MMSLNGEILVVKTFKDSRATTVFPGNKECSGTVMVMGTTCAGSAQDSRRVMHRPPFNKIVRRLIALPFLFVGMVIMFLAILIGFGYQEAIHFWRNC